MKTKLKKITQKEVINRIYLLKKQQWMNVNISEPKSDEVKFINGVRYERSLLDGELKPFWNFKIFDASVSMQAFIKRDVKMNLNIDLSRSILKNEYYVVCGNKII